MITYSVDTPWQFRPHCWLWHRKVWAGRISSFFYCFKKKCVNDMWMWASISLSALEVRGQSLGVCCILQASWPVNFWEIFFVSASYLIVGVLRLEIQTIVYNFLWVLRIELRSLTCMISAFTHWAILLALDHHLKKLKTNYIYVFVYVCVHVCTYVQLHVSHSVYIGQRSILFLHLMDSRDGTQMVRLHSKHLYLPS